MKYFVIVSLGYDGLTINRYDDLSSAKAEFDRVQAERKHWNELYPNEPCDKGIAIVEGEVVEAEDEDDLFG